METQVKRIERTALLLVVVATAVSVVFWDWRIVLGVALGGGLAALNFHVLRRIMQSLFKSSGAKPQQQAALGVVLMLKFAVLGTIIFLVIRFVPVNMVALMAGISVVVAAIFIEGICTLLRGVAAESE